MNEKKKMIILFVIIGLFIAALGMVALKSYMDEKREVEKFYEIFNSEKRSLIFIGRDGCYYCQLQKPILEDFDEQYQFGYYYLNTDNIGTNKLHKILEDLSIDVNNFGTPTTVVTEGGNVINTYAGASSEITYFNFLKDNDIIKTNEPNLINYINYSQYKSLIDNNKPGTVIVIGDSHNSGYKTMMKYLRNIIAENNITINYFSALEITQESSAEFATTVLPTMIVINKDGQKVTLEEDKTYDEYVTFLKNNGIMK